MLEHLGEKLIFHGRLGPLPISFDVMTVAMGLAVSLVLVVLALWLRRAIPREPEATPDGRGAFLLGLLEFLERQLLSGYPKEVARALFPLISTLFLYVLLSNWLSVIPYAQSPTQNLNVTLGLALMVYVLSHLYAIRYKGLRRHIRGYLEPYPFLLPMNLIGDFGRTLSHAFRLFGNIFGGAILTAIVLNLASRALLKMPPYMKPIAFLGGVSMGTFLNLWFGLFVGLIQALVFALLASVYIKLALD